ncbi:MBL fold metallo-hydrolase [Zavarzinia sp. CC-PAN008]|uniref:MBL fold metallo-hydrolase n=1 Tax=Zavarzinia sp. CC-PAN008 TaxID=3243332 RepID=UPI003F742447
MTISDVAEAEAKVVPPVQAVLIPVTPFQQNCSLIWCTATKRAAIVDPGGEVERILGAVRKMDVTVEKILLTHGHLDHAGGTAALVRQLGVPVEGPHVEDTFLLDSLEEQGRRYGLAGAENVRPDRWLDDGETVTLGETAFEVYHCPGHTPGHVVFFHRAARLALVGDVLFKGSIGRTDLPRGNFNDLVEAISTKLWPLGDDVAFVPGHGEMSTFGWERKCNPFVSDIALGVTTGVPGVRSA